VFAVIFGGDLDVRYEVFAISVAYLGLILGGTMLATMGVRRAMAPITAPAAG
jgi:hypothetical protein